MSGFKKKASVGSEVVLGSGVAELKKVATGITNAVATFNTLPEMLENMQIEIAAKEDRIAQLETEYVEKERQLSVSLNLKVKENEEAVVNKALEAAGKVGVLKAVWDATQQNLADYKEQFETRLKEGVDSASRGIAATYANKEKVTEAEYKAKEAENIAKITTLQGQITFLEGQVKQLLETMDKERAATVERAKAASVGAINFGTGYGK